MVILKVSSDIIIENYDVEKPDKIKSTQNLNYEGFFDYEIMTESFFQRILDQIKETYSWKTFFDDDKADGEEGEGEIAEDVTEFSRIRALNFNTAQVASDRRRIIILREFQQQSIDFVKELKDIKLYTHPTKLNHVYVVEKGFNDVDLLDSNYINFLSTLSKSIIDEDKDLTYIKERYDIKDEDKFMKEGSIFTDFSFVLDDVLWEVTNLTPRNMTGVKGSTYNRDPYIFKI